MGFFWQKIYKLSKTNIFLSRFEGSRGDQIFCILVVADTKLQKIVIAIRGTLSLADVMTDMVARPKSLKTMLTEEFANRNFLCAQEISSLSGGFWAGPAQTKLVKIKKKILPTGLQVMFWV